MDQKGTVQKGTVLPKREWFFKVDKKVDKEETVLKDKRGRFILKGTVLS